MPERSFFIHTGTGILMKRLQLEFSKKVTVTNIFSKVSSSPIDFDPKNHNDVSVVIGFHRELIGGTNIGVTIEYVQDDKPQVQNVIWIDKDDQKHPLSSKEIERINDSDLNHG